MAKVIKRIEEEWGGRMRSFPVVKCGCGEEVTCYSSWANECETCNTEYNGSGQTLNPRSMWGEETGEVF